MRSTVDGGNSVALLSLIHLMILLFRTETSWNGSGQDDTCHEPGESDAIRKTLPDKPLVDNVPSTNMLKVKHDKKSIKEHFTTAPLSTRSKEELLVTQTITRQARKPANGGSYGVPSKGKQSKQRVISNDRAPVNTYTSRLPLDKPDTKLTPPGAELPPLSHAPMSQKPNQPKQAHLTSNIRPPPGLLAPPGFFSQPDINGVSAHSSPSSSPPSRKIQLASNCHPETEIMHCPKLNNDLVYSVERGDESLNSSLFQLPPSGNSPKAGGEIALSTSTYSSHFFTPTLVEPSSNIEVNDIEAPDVRSLLGAGTNFNVSNFLDGILGDSIQQTPARNEVLEKPAVVTEAIPFQTNTTGVPLDPWNHRDSLINNHHLLASQGAINYRESLSLNSNVPSLLAESNLLNFANAIYAEPAYASVFTDDDGEDDDFAEPDSYYNQLLGEDF